MKTSYPWQINSVIHKTKTSTKTLGIDAMLYSPKEEDDVRTPAAPLEMHEGYSVFKGTLIVKKEGTNVVKFNIPAKAVPYIHKKTSMAIDAALKNKSSNNNDSGAGSSPAYIVTFKTGTLSGKTPAQLLLESDKNKDTLENQKKFLERNLEKYPGNKEQIEAITDALNLYASGKLKPESGSKIVGNITTIYECAPKNVKPLDEKGRYTIYQVAITHNPSMQLPFEVSVMNCFAPVDKSSGNEIIMSQAVDKQTQNIRLSEEEWYTMIDTMKATKIMFENLTYPDQLKLAAKISRENYEAAKNE